MIRNEEIIKAIDKTFPYINGGRCYEQSIGASGFELGAQLADMHPKSPWISVEDDLPCNHKELAHSNYTDRVLVSARNGFVEVAFMSKIENVWVWETPIKVSYWMPIPNLPK